MKKAMYALLALLVAAGLAGCGGDGPEGDPPPSGPGGPYTVTFNKNNNDADGTEPFPDTWDSFPVTGTLGGLPFAPTRTGYTFAGWNTKTDGMGTAFTESTIVTCEITVYARWVRYGDPDLMDDGTIFVKYPKFTLSGNCVTYNEADYTYTFASGDTGNMDYAFPTSVGNPPVSSLNYDYFIMLSAVKSSETGIGTQVEIKTFGTSTQYGGIATNKYPWMNGGVPSGEKLLFEVGGRNNTNGFRIYVPSGTAIDKLEITSITFYKAARYTVTFVSNSAVVKTVNNVWGKDDNHPGYSVGTTDWPANPTNGANYFLGWFNVETLYTAATVITGNTTLTARWSTEAPQRWMEQVTNTGTSAPLYGFNITTNDKLGNYDRVTFKLKASGADLTGRLRAWGTFPTSVYTASNFPLSPTAQSGIKNMGNGIDRLLLTNKTEGTTANIEGTNTTPAGITNGMTLTVAEGWKEYTLDLVNGRDSTYGTTIGDGSKWDDNATGTILLAIGVVIPAGGSGARTYFIKDIVLNNGSDKSIPAIDPEATTGTTLWNGNGGSAYVRQASTDGTSRQSMFIF